MCVLWTEIFYQVSLIIDVLYSDGNLFRFVQERNRKRTELNASKMK